MSQHGTPSAREPFVGTRYPQATQQDLAELVSQIAAEAARAAFQAVQGETASGAVGLQQAQPTVSQGTQAGFAGPASGQAGVRSQPQSYLSATQSPHLSTPHQPQGQTQSSDRFFPAVDVIETPEELRVYADLPGVDSQSIQIEAVDNTITLSAERINDGADGEEGTSVMRERGAVMERSLQIPQPVDLDGAEATWDQGVVTITLPKKEPENKREIGVQ